MLILNYHHVGLPEPKARYRGMYVSPFILWLHILILKLRGKKFVTVSEGVRQGLGADLVALTFDDGYIDNLTLGLPVLSKARVPATIYVVTQCVGQKNVLWPESGAGISGDLLNWDQLKILKHHGWEIGSHASDHVHLARRTMDGQNTLIETSWNDFKSNLGHAPTSFAYPYGSFDQNSLDILKRLNCENAVSTICTGTNHSETDRLKLFRQPARGHHLWHAIKAFQLFWIK